MRVRWVLFTVLAGTLLPAAAQTQAPEATIHRDAWGVPHVFSETDAGAVFGMAWALAEDDWPLIEENYLRALGRTAELNGVSGLSGDWMARALRIAPLSIAEYEAAPPRIRMLLDAFAAGMNRWLGSRQPDQLRILRRIEPWYPLALIRFKYYQNEFLGYAGLRNAWIGPMLRRSAAAVAGPAVNPGIDGAAAVSGDDVARIDSGAAVHDFALEAQFDRLGHRPRGSNEWAIAPSRTADGSTLLLINPHQSFVGVQRYAEIHLDSREGLRFSGLTVFGFLLPYMGNNERLGWAYTDNYADHSDLYGLVFDDTAAPLHYRYGGAYRAAEAWTDSIRVRTANGVETRTFRFWNSHYGPIVGVADDGRPLAVKLARMVEGGWFDQWDAMIRARTLETWKAAAAMLRVPYMNTMYADAGGNIGYIYNSAVPRRLGGIDPSGILDGSDPRTEWQGFHALDELPQGVESAHRLAAQHELDAVHGDNGFVDAARGLSGVHGRRRDGQRPRGQLTSRAERIDIGDVRGVRASGLGHAIERSGSIDSGASAGVAAHAAVARAAGTRAGRGAAARVGSHCRHRFHRDHLVRAGVRTSHARSAADTASCERAGGSLAVARATLGHDRGAVGPHQSASAAAARRPGRARYHAHPSTRGWRARRARFRFHLRERARRRGVAAARPWWQFLRQGHCIWADVARCVDPELRPERRPGVAAFLRSSGTLRAPSVQAGVVQSR